VLLGDSGDAIIGAGIVRRFRYLGVGLSSPLSEPVDWRSEKSGAVTGESIELLGDGKGREDDESLVGLADGPSCNASLARSSHLPRIVSKLAPVRCVGVHRRGDGVVPDDEPVESLRTLMLEELLLEREALFARDSVGSSRRAWYAKGAVVPDRLFDGIEEPGGLKGSMLFIPCSASSMMKEESTMVVCPS